MQLQAQQGKPVEKLPPPPSSHILNASSMRPHGHVCDDGEANEGTGCRHLQLRPAVEQHDHARYQRLPHHDLFTPHAHIASLLVNQRLARTTLDTRFHAPKVPTSTPLACLRQSHPRRAKPPHVSHATAGTTR